MNVQEKDTHEGRFLTVDHGQQAVGLDIRLIESLDNRYILRPLREQSSEGILRYNVSGCENIRKYLINRRMDRTELVGFLAQMKSVIRALEDHMLTDGNILLDPEYVYIDKGTRKVRFVPVCRLEGPFEDRFRPLAEMIFCHADLEDTESLRFAARMMRTVMEGNLKMHTLMELADLTPAAGRQERRNPQAFSEEADTAEVSEGEVTVLLSDLKDPVPPAPSLPEEPETEKTSGARRGFFSGLAARFREDDEDDE